MSVKIGHLLSLIHSTITKSDTYSLLSLSILFHIVKQLMSSETMPKLLCYWRKVNVCSGSSSMIQKKDPFIRLNSTPLHLESFPIYNRRSGILKTKNLVLGHGFRYIALPKMCFNDKKINHLITWYTGLGQHEKVLWQWPQSGINMCNWRLEISTTIYLARSYALCEKFEWESNTVHILHMEQSDWSQTHPSA